MKLIDFIADKRKFMHEINNKELIKTFSFISFPN